MTKFLNRPEDAVTESLRGFARAHADLVHLEDQPRFVRRKTLTPGKVALISGGGSGHDPMHAGFVGRGMLDAAVPGEVFSSPSTEQILAAAEAVGSDAGLLCIIKNYAGDLMNFEMAMELYDGPNASMVVQDDVGAAGGSATVGRRGVAGTVVVEKIVGAFAEQGGDLEGCRLLAESVAAATRSMGVALGGCRVPTSEKPNLELPLGEMEIGVGIHGEPGRRRGPITSADAIVEELMETLLADMQPKAATPLLLFINGLGGTPPMEQYILYDAAARILDAKGLTVARSIVAPLCSSLEMPGASITLTALDDQMLALWDDPVHTPGLRWGV
ncbi:dihydroxyacetone kinase subunit DhaK [Sphingobium nicotianae]|uniref:Dihydroxyacetone kinase subunit DhaK n=1 Tax=Sphingobium nicotianae TaxID=2782607 RepID=A0A9X1ITA1_9SPHN|nr:dihydroxyacetone kinase subunit DhaK [Sphingobium nicotianae]MBT2189102.1 dihydroxyacetone kinase subunit DhaK [Sphingobium nicotianae]